MYLKLDHTATVQYIIPMPTDNSNNTSTDLDNVTEADLTETEALGLELDYSANHIRFTLGEEGVLALLEQADMDAGVDAGEMDFIMGHCA